MSTGNRVAEEMLLRIKKSRKMRCVICGKCFVSCALIFSVRLEPKAVIDTQSRDTVRKWSVHQKATCECEWRVIMM